MSPEEQREQEQVSGNGGWGGWEGAGEGFPDAEELDRRLRALVRERPFLSVAAAVAAGFVLGRLLSRI